MKTNFLSRLLRLDTLQKKGDGKRLELRYLYSALGVILIGIGCGLAVEMALGCDSYTSFNRGIWYILTEAFGHFAFGHINLTVNVILFICMVTLRRDLIGFGTLFNMVTVGYIIDLVQYLFSVLSVSGADLSIPLRTVIIIVALPITAFGGALYTEAELGVSPYDSIPFIAEKLTHGKLSFGLLRTLTDCFFLTGGLIFGFISGKQWELVNVGTVILALGTGYIIAYFRRVLPKLA